jgi:hypothetical protein
MLEHWASPGVDGHANDVTILRATYLSSWLLARVASRQGRVDQDKMQACNPSH